MTEKKHTTTKQTPSQLSIREFQLLYGSGNLIATYDSDFQTNSSVYDTLRYQHKFDKIQAVLNPATILLSDGNNHFIRFDHIKHICQTTADTNYSDIRIICGDRYNDDHDVEYRIFVDAR